MCKNIIKFLLKINSKTLAIFLVALLNSLLIIQYIFANDFEIYFYFSPINQNIKIQNRSIVKETQGKLVDYICLSRNKNKFLLKEISKLQIQNIMPESIQTSSHNLEGYYEDIDPKESYNLLHLFYEEALQGLVSEQSDISSETENIANFKKEDGIRK